MKKGINLVILLIIIVDCLIFRLCSIYEFHNEIEWFIILNNIILVGFFLLKYNEPMQKNINIIIFISFIARIIALFLDRKGFYTVFTGGDTEAFYNAAIGNINFNINYVNFLKMIVYFLGTSRLVLQYLNVVISLFTLILFDKTLKMVLGNRRESYIIRRNLVLLFSFVPIYIFLSSCLLRETVMIFCNMVSIYFFVKWYNDSSIKDYILANLFVIFSSWFHSGMLVTLIPLNLFLVFYSHKEKRIVIKKNAIFIIITVLVMFFALFKLFGSSLTSYFNRVNSFEDLTVRNAIGSTDYLNILNGQKSIPIIIGSTPLKVLYFFFSPMPWDCNSINVLLVFLFSSTVYIYFFIKIITSKSSKNELKKMLIIIIIFLGVTYSWGTWNAGTAMRHREKLLPYFCVLCCLCERNKKNEKKENIIHSSN